MYTCELKLQPIERPVGCDSCQQRTKAMGQVFAKEPYYLKNSCVYLQLIQMKEACTWRCQQSNRAGCLLNYKLYKICWTDDPLLIRNQWELALVHLSRRRKSPTALEMDVKLLLSVEGAGYIWGIAVSCITGE